MTSTDVELDRGILSPTDRRRRRVKRPFAVLQTLTLVALLISGLFPILWLLKSALSPTQQILKDPLALWPAGGPDFNNVVRALTEFGIGRSLVNTAVLAAGAAVTTLLVASTLGFVLSVLKPWWAPLLSAAVSATLFIPAVVILVPLYLTILDVPVIHANLLNSYAAVWLPAGANAFSVLVVKRFFDTIPPELYDAARLDGAGAFRLYWSLVLPLSRPILGVVALLAVIASWKDFLWPLLVLQDPSLQPVSVLLPKLAPTTPLNLQMAQLFLALIIPVLLFLAFQRQVLNGVGLSGGVKE